MTSPSYRSVFIVGAGAGLSASLARLLGAQGLRVALGARNVRKLEGLVAETRALPVEMDASDPQSVHSAFRLVETHHGAPDVVIYNAGARVRGPIVDLDPAAVHAALDVTAYGGFLVAREAAQRMVARSTGAIVFTGASASVKGYAESSPFAMGKFALRGLAQSLARELAPCGIHVAHFVIDGGIRSASRPTPAGSPDSLLDPDAIAASYLQILRQDRSAWTWEIELRPWVERF